jgi:pyrroloquinoline quinone biosynthesis protein B
MTIEAVLLGIAQDGGVPQAGCRCPRCVQALIDPKKGHRVVCLGIIDRQVSKFWLIDATPDLPVQLGLLTTLAPDCSLAGICLTHAHMGHYSGLVHLGQEAINASNLPLLCSERMADFLVHNQPWSALIKNRHVDLQVMEVDKALFLSQQFAIKPFAVPHRDEFSDTLAFLIQGPERNLFYCPDINSWAEWDHQLMRFFVGIDIALLDGTFYNSAEVPGRNLDLIQHPFAADYPDFFPELVTETYLVHLNHTNPLLDNGPERAWLRGQGFHVGYDGQRWTL